MTKLRFVNRGGILTRVLSPDKLSERPDYEGRLGRLHKNSKARLLNGRWFDHSSGGPLDVKKGFAHR
jgi:hypothetical protein